MEKTRVGVIGCGTISGIYLKNSKWFESFEIVALADLFRPNAEARAKEFGIPRVCTVDELLEDTEISVVLNLTVPQAHAEVALRTVRAGKSVYNEKPLTLTREEGQQLLAEARARGVRVSCAPDTFLGGGIQTCRQLIDEGAIGAPVAATAFFASHGPENWHPNPEFYYQAGAGPMFDMGPYYLTALIALIGPVQRVAASARATFPTRLIGSEPKKGQIIQVTTPTHIAATLDFANGAIGTILTSFDIWGNSLPRIEIYGSEGSLSVPDPNTFGGPVLLRRAGEKDWTEVPVTRAYAENSRIIGAADMIAGIRSGRPHRATGDLAYHVLDIMHATLDSSVKGEHIAVASTCERPAPLPEGLTVGTMDE